MKYIVALDQGTTSSRAVVVDENGKVVAVHGMEFPQIYPQPGWVEHDPAQILSSQVESLKKAVEKAAIDPKDIVGIGITNQRETTIIWDKATGKPVCNAIVWQCRRTAAEIERLKAEGASEIIRKKTGLIPDAYFCGSKIQWILRNVPGTRVAAQAGELLFGTVDTWLIWNLTREHAHVTDVSNASRTMLFNIHTMDWDRGAARSDGDSARAAAQSGGFQRCGGDAGQEHPRRGDPHCGHRGRPAGGALWAGVLSKRVWSRPPTAPAAFC